MNKGRSKTDVDILDKQPESQGMVDPATSRVRSISMPATHHSDDSPEASGDSHTPNGSPAELQPNGVEHVDITLPSLDQPVPSEWVTIEDNFATVFASYQSHLGPEMMATPSATLLDGLIHLVIIRAPVTRMQMLNMMVQLETGAHIKNSFVEIVAVKAFRLEPDTNEGNLVVDGEKVPYGKIQGKVLPGMARVMAK